jgi:formylglycine-generating enzyme required for sulfatase activity
MKRLLKMIILLQCIFLPSLIFTAQNSRQAMFIQNGKQTQRFFVIKAKGVIDDKKTGLMWQLKPLYESMTFEDAKKYAENLRLGGFNNWRIPTVEEWKRLLEGHLAIDVRTKKALPPYVFLNRNGFKVEPRWVWTNSEDRSGRILQVFLENGSIATSFKGESLRLICVRNNR